jgi:hypothetical protein
LLFAKIIPGLAIEIAVGLGVFVLGAAFANSERLRRSSRQRQRGNEKKLEASRRRK